MLKIKPPNYIFCPFCNKKLSTIKEKDGRKRKFCRFCQWAHYPHVAAGAAAIIVKGKKVLMVQRAMEPHKDTWMFPAGFIEYGEHPLDTLKREIKEETNLSIKKARLIEIFQSQEDSRSPGHFIFFYKATVSEGKLKTDKENKGIAWVDIKNPPKIGFKTHKYIMRLLQRGLI